MNLVIRAHSLKTETLSQAITGHFDERGGTIGRSDTNTLALPDPERHISRLQAEVRFSDGCFFIRNVGSANAISINGRPLNPGEGCVLAEADEMVIGAYTMRASLGDPNAWEPPTEGVPTDSRTVIRTSAPEPRTNPRMRSANLAGSGTAAMPVVPRSAEPARSDAGASNPFADLLGSSASAPSSDPFAGLLGDAPAPPPPAAAPVRQPSRPAAGPSASLPGLAPAAPPAPSRLPDDFDPFADLPVSPPGKTDSAMSSFFGSSPAPHAGAPSPALPPDLGLGDLLGVPSSETGGSLDTMFGLKGPATRDADPLAGFLTPSKAEAASGTRPVSTDPLAMFGSPTPADAAPAIPADFNHTPEMQSAYRPPAVQSPPPPPPAPARQDTLPHAVVPRAPVAAPVPAPRAKAPEPPSTDTVPGLRPRREAFATSAPASLDAQAPHVAEKPLDAASADALWAAFCDGAGISMKPPQGLNPELMRIIGQVLSRTVDGTLKLVAVRAAAKQELRADVTMIQARNNNPLKFSPDAGAAILQMLQPPMRGFMVGPAAVTEVMDDLVGHAIGTMAGMRAALEGVLKRFEPGQLEGKLAANSMLDAVLPMNRRAKLWELYLQHYQRIHDEAQDDFHDLFGKAFIAAYEDQLDRLDAARHPV